MQLLRKILFPFSLLYLLIVKLRNFLFNKQVFKSTSFNFPLICVGNLSVGGTGKTPMIEYLISLLKDEYEIGVLSRGYKRKTNGFLLAKENITVEELGDEPFQYYRKFKNIKVAVDANRVEGVSKLKNEFPELDAVLLDDAFQHRKIKAKFNILLTVYNDLFVDDLMLPTGNLRDAKAEANRAQIIVVTKCPENLSIEEREYILKKIKPQNNQNVYFTAISYASVFYGETGVLSFPEAMKNKFTLVTGIAKPKPLVSFLKKHDFNFEHKEYADHHHFSSQEIEELRKESLIITTEKDFVRLQYQLSNVFYLPIKVDFLFNQKEEFDWQIRNVLK
ncbi:tetraacyldisaccharide 4'-kinase [Zhouia sp. PK063]|uniref:tetraacyldisaccharide 4'-kinase n=1 Tax=Zhouia sp. PK063 TaxID=3373602 RepID=UPI0037A44E2E